MNYLIPANSKKSLLKFGLFTTADLILLAIGIAFTILLLLILDITQLPLAIISLMPATIIVFLVLPIPNYYNMRTLITSIITFYTNQRKFKWKGWEFLNGEEKIHK